jgi:hypothetical protein
MRIALAFLAIVATSAHAQSNSSAPTRVQGHVTKQGTYVPPHVRSAPNGTQRDNFSTQGNYNPYNGKTGTREAKK